MPPKANEQKEDEVGFLEYLENVIGSANHKERIEKLQKRKEEAEGVKMRSVRDEKKAQESFNNAQSDMEE